MIISASRRTDIPAFYSEWFINRIRMGWCEVPNPLNAKQLSYVPLRPQDVTAIVFWSKNPAPIIQHLRELDERGFRYYFQFTLNDYPKILEPRIPSLKTRLTTFKTLSEKTSPLRVIWRYDPIIISNKTPIDYHLEQFYKIASSLKDYTHRVMVSLVDYYQKTNLRIRHIENNGFHFEKTFSGSENALSLFSELFRIANQNRIEIYTCAEEFDYSQIGIRPGACIDGDLINKIWSLELMEKKDISQRAVCRCISSKDIGINDTCLHGCLYCYATRSMKTASNRRRQHKPDAPVIWGSSRDLSEREKTEQSKIRLFK